MDNDVKDLTIRAKVLREQAATTPNRQTKRELLQAAQDCDDRAGWRVRRAARGF